VSEQRHSELVGEAATAEGGYESFIIRIVLEHDLSKDQRAALWCLRFALKELRYAVRDSKPLNWWRSDFRADDGYREYQAFKGLVPIVVRILIEPGPRSTWSGRFKGLASRLARILAKSRQPSTRPGSSDRATALREVTGDGKVFTGSPRFAPLRTEERRKQKDQVKQEDADAEMPGDWVLLAEQLGQPDLSIAPDMKASQ
jgi:hypothetical protein